MSKSSMMAVVSLFFMFLTLIIMYNDKLALIASVILWLGSASYSVFILIKEKKRNESIKKEGNNYEK